MSANYKEGMTRLLIDDAHGRSSVFELEANELIVGRSPDAGLVLDDAHASRRHACITRDAGEFAIKDLNSGNGLYVNGERVSERALAHGDVIRIGHSRLVFDNGAGSSELKFDEKESGNLAILVRRIEAGRRRGAGPTAEQPTAGPQPRAFCGWRGLGARPKTEPKPKLG